jgi:hypothetical protein
LTIQRRLWTYPALIGLRPSASSQNSRQQTDERIQ